MHASERRYAELLTDGTTSVLMTDGYKFSMAQAGFPLRPETFYLACRKGGPYFIPFDFAEVVRAILGPTPRSITLDESEYLNRVGYGLTPAMHHAWTQGPMVSWSPPVGSWVGNGEPMLTVTGPSFLVSWLEPFAIMFRFAVQVATAAMEGETTFRCTCDSEAEIVKLVLDRVGRRAHFIEVDSEKYHAAVHQNAAAIVTALNGEGHRAFEVGMRAATCMKMHQIAVEACKSAGLTKTSNVRLAKRFTLTPVGTTGHEHQQRWLSDEAGFRAIRDMRSGVPSYLFDTYDALVSGIPAAVAVMREDLQRQCAVRFDSGDQVEQLRRFLIAEGHYETRPNFIFEDGLTADRTAEWEDLCTRDVTNRGFGLERKRLSYGYGGFIVNPVGAVQLRRDDASAVFKLSMTGTVPVMKTCGSKSSLPGVPVILAREDGVHLVVQEGETVEGLHPLSSDDPKPWPSRLPLWSKGTEDLMAVCLRRAGAGR